MAAFPGVLWATALHSNSMKSVKWKKKKKHGHRRQSCGGWSRAKSIAILALLPERKINAKCLSSRIKQQKKVLRVENNHCAHKCCSAFLVTCVCSTSTNTECIQASRRKYLINLGKGFIYKPSVNQ